MNKIFFKDIEQTIQRATENKNQIKRETLRLVELYGQNVLNLYKAAKELYEIDHDQEHLKKISTQTTTNIDDVLQQYKLVQEMIISSAVYNQLKQLKLAADYYLNHQKLIQSNASEQEIYDFKKKETIKLGNLHNEIMTIYEKMLIEGVQIQSLWGSALALMTMRGDQFEREGISLQQFREGLEQEMIVIAGKIADKGIRNNVQQKLEANFRYIVKPRHWGAQKSRDQQRKDML